ncbi:DUF2470 domain-containing protein [Streptomyces sp. DSM 42041]|uniref:DUF2470 domain-containing protein n=1 Tax=Streptomyces hazeniae TaxID=3075538 RepID=A0ABU2NYX6_9ACTN|nr:DUF2470 domain-containing protein [Streptomyces sp. DSM 42041]MDT0381727.1 DUF2470 domain-containing protein [Streptomyces sp. DSM 42041]
MVRLPAHDGRPSSAERLRSAVAAAESLSLTTHSTAYDLIGMHTVDGRGRVHLHAPADSPLTVEALCAPHGLLTARLDFTDIAPTPVRDRVRARVTLSGRLEAAAEQSVPDAVVLRFDTARAELRRAEVTEEVGPDVLARARPDVLATQEAPMLTHLHEDHRDIVAHLAQLAGVRPASPPARVLPYAIDRYGITLRAEDGDGHTDLRIRFPAPVRDASEVREQIDLLMHRPVTPKARARRAPGHGRRRLAR